MIIVSDNMSLNSTLVFYQEQNIRLDQGSQRS